MLLGYDGRVCSASERPSGEHAADWPVGAQASQQEMRRNLFLKLLRGLPCGEVARKRWLLLPKPHNPRETDLDGDQISLKFRTGLHNWYLSGSYRLDKTYRPNSRYERSGKVPLAHGQRGAGCVAGSVQAHADGVKHSPAVGTARDQGWGVQGWGPPEPAGEGSEAPTPEEVSRKCLCLRETEDQRRTREGLRTQHMVQHHLPTLWKPLLVLEHSAKGPSSGSLSSLPLFT